jgi:MraZ protein
MVKMTRSGLFLGEYRYRLDDKFRIALPKRIRVEIEGFEIVLSKGFEPYIAGFDLVRWQKMAEQPLALPYFEERGRQLRRQVFATAVMLELDAQGRIVLPESLVRWAQLETKIGQEIVVVGVGESFEIWSEEKWSQYERK